jgi:hypothetical protein
MNVLTYLVIAPLISKLGQIFTLRGLQFTYKINANLKNHANIFILTEKLLLPKS